ncbi:acetyl-CoA carboxylase biotin carboxyl carrier protein subunit [Marinigracilibium pacificum]|uniref:Acetyl-CoA carboxylase biotin carboxyl carrier protein subunit n=1 Tax=Marinigracilibium pacificum TaxID=2729599 RepID=A0A848J1A6_9BACT|nr:biotin/lipoyl-binding protein [Marinigracilibium pacificum]NMM49451.1 acetyl-CoA carboxylase biotin carboxyl carrier protein subunit [Marinigracilibium pacificum]
MYQAHLINEEESNSDKSTSVNFEDGNIIVDDEILNWDISHIDDSHFHVIKDGIGYKLEHVSTNHEEKIVTLKINGKVCQIKVKDKMDILLEKMGMSDLAGSQVTDIKAPMPGMILEIKVEVGQTIKKGDPVMVLEAMKMENVLKSPGDGEITSIEVKTGQSVEKNQLLIRF